MSLEEIMIERAIANIIATSFAHRNTSTHKKYTSIAEISLAGE